MRDIGRHFSVNRMLAGTELIRKVEAKDAQAVTSACVKSGLISSSSEARRLIEQGGLYVNECQVKTVDEKLAAADFADGTELRLRKGKKKYLIVEIVN